MLSPWQECCLSLAVRAIPSKPVALALATQSMHWFVSLGWCWKKSMSLLHIVVAVVTNLTLLRDLKFVKWLLMLSMHAGSYFSCLAKHPHLVLCATSVTQVRSEQSARILK